jgi:hypothetical protein
MSLLDNVETNKELENALDEMVLKDLEHHYHRADVEAFDIRNKLHDINKGNKFQNYSFYQMQNENLRSDLREAMSALSQFRQEVSDLYAYKTILLALIGEMFGIISHNSTENQNDILTQILKRELGDIDFARVKAYAKRLQ